MSILSRFRRPTSPAELAPLDDFSEMADLYPPAVLPPVCPVVEPADPMAALVVALDALPTGGYEPLSYSFTGVDASNELLILGDLAARIAGGMSPLAAAQAKFGGSHA